MQIERKITNMNGKNQLLRVLKSSRLVSSYPKRKNLLHNGLFPVYLVFKL